MKLNFLPAETFRAGRLFKLVETSRIRQSAPVAPADVLSDQDVFGLFVPDVPGNDLSPKIAYKDVALLYYFLQTEGTLPYFIRNGYDDQINLTLARLVLDGIFEICIDGRFVSGAAAQAVLYKENKSIQSSTARLPAISEKAIRYVLKLNEPDARSIARKLYCYNTMPAGKRNYTQISDSSSVEKYLGITADMQKRHLQGWKKQSPTREFNWISWYRRHVTHVSDYSNQPTYKIYISPSVDALPNVFNQFISVLPSTRATSFKVGACLQGLLRPDKLMIYFKNYQDLTHAAQILVANLTCDQVQGVPFTCPIDSEGLLSWGIDPPRAEILKDMEGGSWRAGITDKIAIAAGQARAENIRNQDAFDFIMKKLSLLGVDPPDWTPNQNLSLY